MKWGHAGLEFLHPWLVEIWGSEHEHVLQFLVQGRGWVSTRGKGGDEALTLDSDSGLMTCRSPVGSHWHRSRI